MPILHACMHRRVIPIDLDPSLQMPSCVCSRPEILHRLQLWQISNELIFGTSDKFIQQLHLNNTSTYASCASCRKPIGGAPAMATALPGNEIRPPQGSSATSLFCTKCRTAVTQCTLW